VTLRLNYAAFLAEGKPLALPGAIDALGLARRHGRANDVAEVLAFFADLLLGTPAEEGRLKQVQAALGPQATLTPETARRIVTLVLSMPEAQVC
jgi:hypothetical protein